MHLEVQICLYVNQEGSLYIRSFNSTAISHYFVTETEEIFLTQHQ